MISIPWGLLFAPVYPFPVFSVQCTVEILRLRGSLLSSYCEVLLVNRHLIKFAILATIAYSTWCHGLCLSAVVSFCICLGIVAVHAREF